MKRAKPTGPAEMRRLAEERLAREAIPTDRETHELRVHQIELEMQNEELRDASAELEAVAASYTELNDFAPVGYYSIRGDGVVTRCNLAGAELLGMERAKVQGRRLHAFLSPGSVVALEGVLGLAFQSAAAQSCNVEIATPGALPRFLQMEIARSPNGDECRVAALDITARELALCLQRGAEAEARRLLAESNRSRLGMMEALEEQRRVEQSLRESEERFRLMVEGSEQVVFYTLDTLDTLQYVSPSAKAVLGYAPSELVGKPFAALLAPEAALDAQVAVQAENVPVSGAHHAPHPVVLLHKDGRRMVLEIAECPILRGEKVVGIQGFAKDITERAQAETRLRRHELLLHLAGKIGRIGGWSVDLATKKVEWSREVYELLEWPSHLEPTIECALRMATPEWEALARGAWEACMHEGMLFDIELAMLSALGKPMWARAVGSAVKDREGRSIRIEGALQDITARKKAELEIAKASRALQLRNKCNEALVLGKTEGGLLAAICKILTTSGGYKLAWVGTPVSPDGGKLRTTAHAGPADDEFLAMDIRLDKGSWGLVLNRGEPAVIGELEADPEVCSWLEEARKRDFGGVVFLPLRAEYEAIGVLALFKGEPLDPDPEELHLLKDLADGLAFGLIMLRARGERAAAARLLARQAALIDKATDAILVKDLERRVLFWSKGAERTYGWTREEMINRETTEALKPNSSALEAAMKSLFEQGEWLGELAFKHKNGRPIVVDCRWTLLLDAKDKPESILAIETDVTEKKALTTRYLRAQRMESIGTLAGGIAHDINNVLAPILMSIELLKLSMPDEGSKSLLDTIHNSARRGADLIKQLLSFARGLQGERIKVDPKHLLEDVLGIVRESFPKNISMEWNNSDENWWVVGDPTQLHQVFMNLCVNSRDAMPNGGTLRVGVENIMIDETFAAQHPGARPGPHLVCRIADSGEGIEANAQERIFEPFFTTKEFGQGTGLGLSTSLAIVKSHGGFIHLESSPGMGAVFEVFLPAVADRARWDVAPSLAQRTPEGEGELILLVDDEEPIRRVTQHMLTRRGYRVLLAANGVEAISLYARERDHVAVVLTDLAMPLMDGQALIVALRTLNPDVKILVSSGHGDEKALARALESGALQFIPKPFSSEALLGAISKTLGKPAQDPAAA